MSFGKIYSTHIPNENAYYAWSHKMRGILDPKREFDVIDVISLPVQDIAAITGLSGEILRGISKLLAHRHILKQGIANSDTRISVFDAESGFTNHFRDHVKRLGHLPPDFDMMFWHSPDPFNEYDGNFVELLTVSSLPSYIINGPFMPTLLSHFETRPWVAFSPYISDMVNDLISTNQAFVLGPRRHCVTPSPRSTRAKFNEVQTALTQPVKQALLDAADTHFNDS